MEIDFLLFDSHELKGIIIYMRYSYMSSLILFGITIVFNLGFAL
jgi:hypothetical protein